MAGQPALFAQEHFQARRRLSAARRCRRGRLDGRLLRAIEPFAAAQAILGLAAFLVISIGASVAIVRITDRHVAQLPSSVQLATIHRHRICR